MQVVFNISREENSTLKHIINLYNAAMKEHRTKVTKLVSQHENLHAASSFYDKCTFSNYIVLMLSFNSHLVFSDHPEVCNIRRVLWRSTVLCRPEQQR